VGVSRGTRALQPASVEVVWGEAVRAPGILARLVLPTAVVCLGLLVMLASHGEYFFAAWAAASLIASIAVLRSVW
jgi:hypothetical protein